jgi:hypothetical protein
VAHENVRPSVRHGDYGFLNLFDLRGLPKGRLARLFFLLKSFPAVIPAQAGIHFLLMANQDGFRVPPR